MVVKNNLYLCDGLDNLVLCINPFYKFIIVFSDFCLIVPYIQALLTLVPLVL